MLDRSSRIKGSLVGGAAGDALGYAIEFDLEDEIFFKYGENGITSFDLDDYNGKALISDDTQMTLFTAYAILRGEAHRAESGEFGWPSQYAVGTYMDWLYTQGISERDYKPTTWLAKLPEMHAARAPGGTCLSALGKHEYGTRKNPMNGSKGCGGIMRVAPIGLYYTGDRWEGQIDYRHLLEDAADVVEITHGHPLGYLPSVAVVHIIHEIMNNRVSNKEELIAVSGEAIELLYDVFSDEEQQFLDEMKMINELAIELAGNNDTDLNNIHEIGEGWVAEETYGIALYCCLRHFGDFSSTIISAVNHNGDSDSTGAVAGNIMGAIVGYEAIDDSWKDRLELIDVILEIAESLTVGDSKESELSGEDLMQVTGGVGSGFRESEPGDFVTDAYKESSSTDK